MHEAQNVLYTPLVAYEPSRASSLGLECQLGSQQKGAPPLPSLQDPVVFQLVEPLAQDRHYLEQAGVSEHLHHFLLLVLQTLQIFEHLLFFGANDVPFGHLELAEFRYFFIL